MAQVDQSNLIFSIIGIIFLVNSGAVTIMFRMLLKQKDEFDKHKESVQYKDVCIEIHKGIMKLADERHQDVKTTLERIEELIRNNGNPKPRIQT